MTAQPIVSPESEQFLFSWSARHADCDGTVEIQVLARHRGGYRLTVADLDPDWKPRWATDAICGTEDEVIETVAALKAGWADLGLSAPVLRPWPCGFDPLAGAREGLI